MESCLQLLGLFIDNNLDYSRHTKIVCGRLIGKLNSLEALQNKASFKTLKEVTVSLIHSTKEFMAELYLKEHKNQVLVQKKLNSCALMLLKYDFDASVGDMLFTLRWLNVDSRLTHA